MRLVSFGLSDLGNKRKNNEDRFIRDDRRGIYVVCDGMGGAAAGEVASGNAASQVYSTMVGHQELLDGLAAGDGDALVATGVALEDAIRDANLKVFKSAQKNPDRKGMGSTLTALVVGADTAVVGHVGDSRVYHCHSGQTRVVTQDHTWVAEQVRLGKMTPEEAAVSKKHNLILRAIGIRADVKVDIHHVPVVAGDKFLLCSDGLHGYLQSDVEAGILMNKKVPAQRRALECISLARERGGKDNITAILLDVEA